MGCPAKKVCSKAAGSALLRDEKLVGAILSAVVGAVPDTPVTLKMRTGWSPAERNGVRIARIAEDCGIRALSVHGRTRECRFEGYKGRVGLFELFQMDPMTRDATYRGKSTMAIRDQARLTGGLKSLREDGIRKVLEGITTLEEVFRVSKRVE